MVKAWAFLVVGTAVAVGGCATSAQFLDSKQSMAIQTAVTRGQFELNCPTATGTVLSKEVVQPPMRGPWVGGVQRGEYTVGVSGCDKRMVFAVSVRTEETAASPRAPADRGRVAREHRDHTGSDEWRTRDVVTFMKVSRA